MRMRMTPMTIKKMKTKKKTGNQTRKTNLDKIVSRLY
jgi:hypothetical protein